MLSSHLHHLIIFFFCVLNAKAKTFKDFEREPDRIMCWIPYAENYEVAFQFPPEHYTVVICNDLGASGTNASSEEASFSCSELFRS